MNSPSLLSCLRLTLVLPLLLSPSVTAQDSRREGLDVFEKHVRPLLAKHCYECHSAESSSVKGNLKLDTRTATLKGGDSGPALVAGKPDDSLLLKSVMYDNPDLQMPPKGKLSEDEIA
ncbi:MAG: c-type cytochrome domain-containing protein, partial [Planctomyces sp.]